MRILIITLLFAHTAISLFILKDTGYLSVFPPFNDLATYQVFSDLGAALAIVHLFFYRELRKQGRSLKPLLFCGVGTLLLGSVAPLVYLLIDKRLLRSP